MKKIVQLNQLHNFHMARVKNQTLVSLHHYSATKTRNSLLSHGTFCHFQARHSLCFKQDISCVPSRTFRVFQTGHLVCSKQDISCVPSRTSLVFQAGHLVCSKQDIPCVRRQSFAALRNGSKCHTDLKNRWIWSKIHRATWFWRPKKPSSSKIYRKSWKTGKKIEKKISKKKFRRQKIENCKSSETRFAEVSRRSEPCSKDKRTFEVRRRLGGIREA